MSLPVSSFKDFRSTSPRYFPRYQNAGIPQNFWGLSFADYVLDKKILVLVQNYIRHFEEMTTDNVGMSLFGPSGSGKSMLAAIIAKYVAALHAKNVRWVQLDDLIFHLNKSWVDDDARLRFIAMVQSPTLLVLDDVPKTANQSKDVAKLVHTVIRYRAESGRPLIVTTSYTESQLTKLITEDVVKELLELSPKVEITSKENFRERVHLKKLDVLRQLTTNDEKDI